MDTVLHTKAYLRRDSLDPETNIRDFVITNEALDRHGTVIKLDGWDLTNYRANPVVMYAHAANRQPDPDLVIGRGEVFRDGDNLVGRIHFDVEGEGVNENKIAKKVLYKIDKGQLSTTSVGFNPFEWGWGEKDKGEDESTFYFRNQELLEFSVVPVPSNPTAGKRDFDEIRSFVETHKRAEDASTIHFAFDAEDVDNQEDIKNDSSNKLGLWRAKVRRLKKV